MVEAMDFMLTLHLLIMLSLIWYNLFFQFPRHAIRLN